MMFYQQWNNLVSALKHLII